MMKTFYYNHPYDAYEEVQRFVRDVSITCKMSEARIYNLYKAPYLEVRFSVTVYDDSIKAFEDRVRDKEGWAYERSIGGSN